MIKLKGFAAPYMLGAIIGVTVVSTTVANQAREKNQVSYNKYIKEKQNYMRDAARGLDYAVSTEGSYIAASKNRLTQNYYSNAFDFNNSLDLDTQGTAGDKVSVISGDSNPYKIRNRGSSSKSNMLKENNSGKAVISINENKVRNEQVLKSYGHMREASKELYENIIATRTFKMPCTLSPSVKDAWGRDFTYTYVDDSNAKLSFNLPWDSSTSKTLPIQLPQLPVNEKEIREIFYNTYFTNAIPFYLITTDGDLWSMGTGSYGQLGTGKSSERTWVKLAPTNVKKMYMSYDTRDVLVLTEEGDVWAVGYNSGGGLGLGNKTKTSIITKTSLKDIVDIALYKNSYAVDKHGALWVAGVNTSGELGMGDLNEHLTWVQSPFPQTNIKEIHADYGRAFIITTNGELWVAGNNQYGKLGLPSGTSTQSSWIKVVNSGVDRILKEDEDEYTYNAIVETTDGRFIAAGRGISTSWTQYSWQDMGLVDPKVFYSRRSTNNSLSYAMFYIKNNGELWVFGINNDGQMGIGATTTASNWTQTSIANAEKMYFFSRYYSYVQTTDGKVYVSGRNQYGQLGTGDTNDVRDWTDTGLTDVKKMITSYVHVSDKPSIFALKNNGDVWVTGDNSHGQLGLADPSNVLSWTQSPVISGVKDIMSFNLVTYAIKHNGEVWVTGKNISANLGLGSTTNQMGWVKAPIENVDEIIIGPNETLSLKGNTVSIANFQNQTWTENVGPNSNSLSEDTGGSCP